MDKQLKEEILELFFDLYMDNDKTDWNDGDCPNGAKGREIKCSACNKVFNFTDEEHDDKNSYLRACSDLSDYAYHRRILKVLREEGYIDEAPKR